MEQPQLNIDLSKSQAVQTPDGKNVWQQGYVLRKLSKFVTGTSEDAFVPIPIFYAPNEFGEGILVDMLPSEIREEYLSVNPADLKPVE
jgi:hypothetical protein